jgi:hypothetical protein
MRPASKMVIQLCAKKFYVICFGENMTISHEQIAGQNYNIKTTNGSFEYMANFVIFHYDTNKSNSHA